MPSFSTSKNGYNIVEVDEYISKLESVIADYKSKDSAISSAILNAQIAADNIIKNAELAANDIQKNAVTQLDILANSIEQQRQSIVGFQDEYAALINKYMKKINSDDFKEMFASVERLDKYIDGLRNIKPEPKTEPKTEQTN